MCIAVRTAFEPEEEAAAEQLLAFDLPCVGLHFSQAALCCEAVHFTPTPEVSEPVPGFAFISEPSAKYSKLQQAGKDTGAWSRNRTHPAPEHHQLDKGNRWKP